MRRVYNIWIVIIAAFAVTILIGFETGALETLSTSLENAKTGSASPEYSQVRAAVSILDTGTFNFGEHGYRGQQRGPGYPFVLALGFLTFGRNVWVIYFINFLFFIFAIIFLWQFSRHFFPKGWDLVPVSALVLYMGAPSQVWVASYEIFALALSTSAVLTLMRYFDTQKLLWLGASSLIFSVWALEKPAALYFLPFVLAFIIFAKRKNITRKKLFVHLLVFVIVSGVIIGSWSYRNHKEIDTWQIGSGGHTLLRSSSQVYFTKSEIISLALSFSVGDLIGSKLYDKYPLDKSPKAWDPSIEYRWPKQLNWIVRDLDGEVLTKTEMDAKMYREAIRNIKAKPFAFLARGFLGLMRLNAPLNHRGQEITRLFVGTHSSIPMWVKIVFILFVRLVWLSVILLAVYAIARHLKDWKTWGLISLLFLYYNGANALLTHAEARYVLVIMPFYFILFTEGLRLRFYLTRNPRG